MVQIDPLVSLAPALQFDHFNLLELLSLLFVHGIDGFHAVPSRMMSTVIQTFLEGIQQSWSNRFELISVQTSANLERS